MTKKHYELISRAIDDVVIGGKLHTKETKEIVYALSARLQDDNANFNSEKFLQACGIKKEH